jgi:photosystem II stability/assembly factor-like uncharacterized protein
MRAPQPRRRLRPSVVAAALAAATVVIISIVVLVNRPAQGQVAWARLGSQDVHSLSFVDAAGSTVLFGHHGGLSRSTDGGRTWSALDVRQDAMSMVPAADGSIIIAGHDVLVASRDGETAWAPIDADLPSLDIHGFTRDPDDPARMWAYLATGGLWESKDFGQGWVEVRPDNVLFPLAVRGPAGTRLIGADPSGLVASDDGGATWTSLSTPETFPLTALAAAADGQVIYAGSPDAIFRSDDGGRSWSPTTYIGSAFAIATTGDGKNLAVVSRETEFFRSPDGGATWPGP